MAGQGGRVHGVHEVDGGRARRGAARERAAPRVAALLAGRGRQATGHPEAGGEGHQGGEGGAGGGKERERAAQGRARRQGHRREVHEAGAGVPPDERGRGAGQRQGAAEHARGDVVEPHGGRRRRRGCKAGGGGVPDAACKGRTAGAGEVPVGLEDKSAGRNHATAAAVGDIRRFGVRHIWHDGRPEGC